MRGRRHLHRIRSSSRSRSISVTTSSRLVFTPGGVVRKRLQQIRDRKEIIGEQNTKAALIDPVLSALGWDLQEIDEVRREYKRKPQDCPVDYALFLNRSECLPIEAKSLEKDLNDRKWLSQNLSYATVVGVQWCILTNGDEYRIYNSHAAVDVDEKLFRSVRISDIAAAGHVVDTLLLLSKEQMRGRLLDELWKAHFVDRNVRAAIETLPANEDASLIRIIQKYAHGVTPAEVKAWLKRAKIRIDFPVVASPFPDGKKVSPPPTPTTPGGDGNEISKPAGSRREAGKKAWETMVAMAGASLENLVASGAVRAPLKIERDYKGVHMEAVILEGGKVEFEHEIYDSLSTAAGMARKAVVGAPPNHPYPATNGWKFWFYRDEKTGEMSEIDALRQAYLNQKM